MGCLPNKRGSGAAAAEGNASSPEEEEACLIPPDPDLQRLLDLRPYVKEEVDRYDDLAVLTLVRKNPEAAAAKYQFRGRHNERGWQYPLKRAVSLGASIEVITLMVEANPHAIEERGQSGLTSNSGTPLHAACVHDRPLEIVKYLAEAHPPALKVTTKHGYTPLHAACELGENAEVVRFLVQMYPAALHKKNKLNRTPAECAMSGGVDGEIKPAVLEALVYKRPPPQPRSRSANPAGGGGRVSPLLIFEMWMCRRQKRKRKEEKRRQSVSSDTRSTSQFSEVEQDEIDMYREEAGFRARNAEIEAFLENYGNEKDHRKGSLRDVSKSVQFVGAVNASDN